MTTAKELIDEVINEQGQDVQAVLVRIAKLHGGDWSPRYNAYEFDTKWAAVVFVNKIARLGLGISGEIDDSQVSIYLVTVM